MMHAGSENLNALLHKYLPALKMDIRNERVLATPF
jgi:hypothetical protein